MIDVNVLEDLVYHIKRSRHQMDLNLRTIRRTKKLKLKEHLSRLQGGLETTHPNTEICQLVDEKADATALIRRLNKYIKVAEHEAK